MSRKRVGQIAKVAVDWMQVPHFRSALTPSYGTGQFWPRSAKSIRLVNRGCTNRAFYHVVVMEVS